MKTPLPALLLLLATMGILPLSHYAEPPSDAVRFATFNASLARNEAGALVQALTTNDDPQAQRIAAIIQRVRPDVLLINEFDFDAEHRAIELFAKNYLRHGWHKQQPIDYPHVFLAPSNTGVPSGRDLNHDEDASGPADAFGFGNFSGQFGMVVLSRYPIVTNRVRTFQKFLWQDMPDAALPKDPETGRPYYSREQLEVLRLSSKSHWDVPIRIDGQEIHLLVAHPTPPVFDGAEDRNGRRNHDEIRFWADYIDPARSAYIYDDAGGRGGLVRGSHFVIAGDLNADPHDGDSYRRAAKQLTDHPMIEQAKAPSSLGGAEAASQQQLANLQHQGDAASDTGDFPDRGPGNLRVDYVLPSRTMTPIATGVFWPPSTDPFRALALASDHRLVWVDVRRPRDRNSPP